MNPKIVLKRSNPVLSNLGFGLNKNSTDFVSGLQIFNNLLSNFFDFRFIFVKEENAATSLKKL